MSSVLNHHKNHLGQPIGFPLPDWKEPLWPARRVVEGAFCTLEPLDPDRHALELHAANAADTSGAMWTYLPYGPFDNLEQFQQKVREWAPAHDPVFFAIRHRPTQRSVGIASYLRIFPGHGTIEIGHVQYSPALQRTPAGTEAIFLLMRTAFELGYRRCEWKCDTLNAPSRRAAERYGFAFEGEFRQATVYKGRNRNTAWYAVIDRDWLALRAAFEAWLTPENFDARGQQRRRLRELTAPLLGRR